MIVTLDDFIREYTKIKDMGWIKTHRSGPTIGYPRKQS